jgi:hypothetical protein
MSGFNPDEMDGEKKSHGQIDHIGQIGGKWSKMSKWSCKNLHENCEKSENSHFSQCIFDELNDRIVS